MNRKLRIRIAGSIILSVLLILLSVSMSLSYEPMGFQVFATENTEKNEENGGNPDNDDAGDIKEETESTESGEEDTELTKPICICTKQCLGENNHNSKCEVCSQDYKNCEYTDPNVVITITPQGGWHNDKANIDVSVYDALKTGNFEAVTIEAKIGQNGSWQDITEDKYIEVTENCSIYVQVTDQNGKIYSKNRNIKAFDRTGPTLNAAISDGLLTVVGQDNDSGISTFYVNGYEFNDFTNNTLNVRLQQFDSGYEYFTVYAMDNAGNMSDIYKTKNPYYDDNPEDDDDKGVSTLPVNANPSAPSSATAMVTEHTKTDGNTVTSFTGTPEEQKHRAMAEADAVEEAEKNGVDTGVKQGLGKEFYTIQTQSEKVFYLIIDRDGEEEKVYFLTEIDENDLLNTTTGNSETLPKNSAALESAIPTGEAALANNNIEMDEPKEESEPEEQEESVPEPIEEVPEKKQSGLPAYILIIIIGMVFVGGWYYLKMVKGKKEDFLDEDDEEDEDDEIYESDEEDEGTDGDEFFRMGEDKPSVENISEEDVAETLDE